MTDPQPTRPELAAMSEAYVAWKAELPIYGSPTFERTFADGYAAGFAARCQPPAPADAGADDVRNAALETALRLCLEVLEANNKSGFYTPEIRAGRTALGIPLQLSPRPASPCDRDAVLEEAAETCIELFRSADNTRESGFQQNKISHGCIECAAAIRRLKSPPHPGGTPEADGEPEGDPVPFRVATAACNDAYEAGYAAAAPRPEPAATATGDGVELQRYDEDGGSLVKDPTGYWCKYEDVARILAARVPGSSKGGA